MPLRMPLVTAAILTISSSAYALNCELTLIQDKQLTSESNASDLARFMMYERAYNKSSGGDGTITLLGKGSGEVSKYKANSDRLRMEGSLEMSSERVFSMATQELSQRSVEAYKECIGALKSTGTRVTIHDATDEAVTLTIQFLGSLGVTNAQLDLDLGSGNSLSSPFPETFQATEMRERIVYRNPETDFRVSAGFGISPDRAFIARTVLPYTPPPWEGRPVIFGGDQVHINIGDGYKLTDFEYDATGQPKPTHWFRFKVRDSNNAVVADVYHEQDNGSYWAPMIGSVQFNQRTLDFAFSNFDNGRGTLNYSWRRYY